MASSLFDVTAESTRRHHLPNLNAFSESSAPALSAVTEAVDEEAAVLAGALALENVDASAITAGSPAWLQCRRVLRMMVALRILRDMRGDNGELSQAWAGEVGRWLKALEDGGASFLGEGATATGTADPDGPTTHINTYGLTKDTSASMSTVVPRLRRDDAL